MMKLLFFITSKSLLLFEQADDCLQEAVKSFFHAHWLECIIVLWSRLVHSFVKKKKIEDVLSLGNDSMKPRPQRSLGLHICGTVRHLCQGREF